MFSCDDLGIIMKSARVRKVLRTRSGNEDDTKRDGEGPASQLAGGFILGSKVSLQV